MIAIIAITNAATAAVCVTNTNCISMTAAAPEEKGKNWMGVDGVYVVSVRRDGSSSCR